MKTQLKFILFALFVMLPISAAAQTARLDLNRLAGLESHARDVVEVNVEGKILDLAKRVLAKTNEPDAQKVFSFTVEPRLLKKASPAVSP